MAVERTQRNAELLAILFVALILRLGAAIVLPLPDDFMYLTEPGRTAVNLVSGRGYTYDFYGTRPDSPLLAFVPPLHPGLIALSLFFPDPALVYGMLQALLGTLTVGLLYQLAIGMAGRRAGTLAGWGAALYPSHILLASQPHSATLHACCLVAVLLACWRVYRRPTVGRALLAGGLVGLFALGRPQIVAFVPIVVGWLWLKRVRGRRLWQVAGALALATAVMILPWSIRNTLLLGRLTLISTNGGINFWNGNNPFTTGSGHDVYADRLAAYQGTERDPTQPDVYEHPWPYPFPAEIEAQLPSIPEPELDQALYRAGLDYIRQHPVDWLGLEGQKALSFWWFRPNLGANPLYQDRWTTLYRIQYASLLALTLAGVVISWKHWRRYALLYATMICYTLVHMAFHVLTRFRWEIELLMLIFAALTLDVAWRKIQKGLAAG